MRKIADGIIESLTKRLMHDVYAPFTVCIWLDAEDSILELYQFDTVFCLPEWVAPDEAQVCLLISNHPEGMMQPYDEDIRNWRRMKASRSGICCQLFIYAEDEGIREIEQSLE